MTQSKATGACEKKGMYAACDYANHLSGSTCYPAGGSWRFSHFEQLKKHKFPLDKAEGVFWSAGNYRYTCSGPHRNKGEKECKKLNDIYWEYMYNKDRNTGNKENSIGNCWCGRRYKYG